jgi:hypothetical protein
MIALKRHANVSWSIYLNNLWVLFSRLFIENPEEGSLPFLIISSSLPEILDECAHVFNAIRWQCLESFCWDARFTWRLVVSKFGDMMLDLRCRGGIPNGLRVGCWEMSSKMLESTGALSQS